MFIKSHWLKELYKNGHLKHVLRVYGKYLNKKSLVGYGTQVCCFKIEDKRIVVKLCPKKIKFFSIKSFTSFKDEINSFNPFFIPVIDILYDDENVFIYRQNICQKINRTTEYITLHVILLVIIMLLRGKIVTDISFNNIGMYHRNVGLFDCHGLVPVSNITDYNRISRNVFKYLDPYTSTSIEKIESLFQDKKKIITYLFKIYNEIFEHIDFSDKKKEILAYKYNKAFTEFNE